MGSDIQYYLSSSISCELRIIRAKNVETMIKPSSNKNLFVRYYLSAGTNKRIQLNSREISSKSHDLLWDESFSLECSSASDEDPMKNLKQETVVFELRCRNTTKKPLFGKLLGGGGSHLLGRVEVPWKTVLESPEMEVEQWFTMSSVSSKSSANYVSNGGVKPPAALLQVGMKVLRVPAATIMEMEKRRRKNGRLLKKWDDQCGCRDGTGCKDSGCNCVDDDIFALAALMEAF